MEIFSSIGAPLTMLTQKKVKCLWYDACEGSFEKLKDKITSVLILTIPKGTNGFVVYYNASRVGMGRVLM